MASRRRFSPPSEQEIAIGRRLRGVRIERHVPRKIIAGFAGMSSQQLNRVERGTVSLRFRPGWTFCEITGTNPLWLAFGQPYPKSGFFAIPELFEPGAIFGWWKELSWQDREEPFLKIMIKSGAAEVYEKHKLQLSETQPEVHLIGGTEREEFKRLAAIEIKHYLTPEMIAPPNWEQLRLLLVAKTQSAQAKQELASLLGVKLASISQWRSGANAPTADNALRILSWIKETEAKQKQSAGSAVTRPARKTRERKSKHE